MQVFYKFPSIEQFRNVVSQLRYMHSHNQLPQETLTFEGTIKLHGTNACVCLYEDGSFHLQSRNRRLNDEDAHMGFRPFIEERLKDPAIWSGLWGLSKGEPVYIFGEWIGQGIQKGVALSQLSQRFVVFAAKSNQQWVSHDELAQIQHSEQGLFNVFQFPTYKVQVDPGEPALIQNRLVEITNKVEEECPAGRFFGVSGLGEGVVWRCVTPGLETSALWFKVKGQKHSVSKVKKLAQVDVEKLRSVQEFVNSVATDQRLAQGVEFLREFDKPLTMQSMGDFIRWVFQDILKEESDTMEASGIKKKELGKPLSTRTRNWYKAFLDEQAFAKEPEEEPEKET